MAGLISLEDAHSGLLAEYPVLRSWGMSIEKRFEAGQGRLSNAFLLACHGPAAPSRQMVAKCVPPHADKSGLIVERQAMKLALSCCTRVPKLSFPQHEPSDFLLMEYLEGADAETVLINNSLGPQVFSRLGETLREVHAIPAGEFASVLGEWGSWNGWVSGRIPPRLSALRDTLGPELYDLASDRIDKALVALQFESDQPRLIHRDIYLSNFLISENLDKAFLIDFGMAMAGSPLFDLAKFYILDLYRFPECLDPFLSQYFAESGAPIAFKCLMELYLYVELVGMIRFFDRGGQRDALAHATTVLRELVDGRGRIVDLLAAI